MLDNNKSEEEFSVEEQSVQCCDLISLRKKADHYWEKSKPKLGLLSNLFGTFGDTAGWCNLFSRIIFSTTETTPLYLIIPVAFMVGVVTFCETLSEYATNQNHNSLNQLPSQENSVDEETGEETPLLNQKSICNWRMLLSLIVAGGAWAGYATGATIAALLSLENDFGDKLPNSAMISINIGLLALGFITTYADIRLKYKNLRYYFSPTSVKDTEIESSDLWTKINPLSNLSMIYGHTTFYKNIVLIIATYFYSQSSSDSSSNSSNEAINWYLLTISLSVGILLGAIPALMLTYSDYIQNTTLQGPTPTVGNQDVKLNKTGKFLGANCRLHYATESSTPGVQGLQQWFNISNSYTLLACFLGLLFSSIFTAADTDSIKGELKKKFSDNSSDLNDTEKTSITSRFRCC